MDKTLHAVLAVAVMAVITLALRTLPFLIFGKKETPPFIEYLGKYLPFAIMGMLVVYCLKEISFTSIGGFLPVVIACAVVGVLYVWKRNTLVSIICGTVCYMLLVQLVF